MFDVSFSEILLIAVVALIVIGPEKLPRVARMLGMLTGRMQRYVASVKAEIDREMQLEEVRRLEQETSKIGSDVQAWVTNETRQVQEVPGSAPPAVEPAKAAPADKPAAQ